MRSKLLLHLFGWRCFTVKLGHLESHDFIYLFPHKPTAQQQRRGRVLTISLGCRAAEDCDDKKCDPHRVSLIHSHTNAVRSSGELPCLLEVS